MYWAKEGRVSVDVGIGGSSLVGSYFAGLPVIREVARRRRAARAEGKRENQPGHA